MTKGMKLYVCGRKQIEAHQFRYTRQGRMSRDSVSTAMREEGLLRQFRVEPPEDKKRHYHNDWFKCKMKVASGERVVLENGDYILRDKKGDYSVMSAVEFEKKWKLKKIVVPPEARYSEADFANLKFAVECYFDNLEAALKEERRKFMYRLYRIEHDGKSGTFYDTEILPDGFAMW